MRNRSIEEYFGVFQGIVDIRASADEGLTAVRTTGAQNWIRVGISMYDLSCRWEVCFRKLSLQPQEKEMHVQRRRSRLGT
jgi:hypothetical protein